MGGGRNTSLLRLKTSGWSSDLRKEAGPGIVGPNFCLAVIKNIKNFPFNWGGILGSNRPDFGEILKFVNVFKRLYKYLYSKGLLVF